MIAGISIATLSQLGIAVTIIVIVLQFVEKIFSQFMPNPNAKLLEKLTDSISKQVEIQQQNTIMFNKIDNQIANIKETSSRIENCLNVILRK